MIVGLTVLEHFSKKLREAKQKPAALAKEHFENAASEGQHDGHDDILGGAEHGILFVVYMIAIAFFILELLLIFYAVKLAIKQSQPGMNRIAHVTLALFFTFPYLLFTLFLGKSA